MAAASFCFAGIFRVFIGSVYVSENSSCDGESPVALHGTSGRLCLRRSGTVEDCLRTGRRPVERGARSFGTCAFACLLSGNIGGKSRGSGRGLLPRREVRLVRSAVVARYGATSRFGHAWVVLSRLSVPTACGLASGFRFAPFAAGSRMRSEPFLICCSSRRRS